MGLRLKGAAAACLVAAAVLAWPTPTFAIEDIELPEGLGKDDTEAACGSCHSLRLVVQQGLTRPGWDELLVWMVEEQEMEPLEPAERKLVIDYLTKHFSPEKVVENRKRYAVKP